MSGIPLRCALAALLGSLTLGGCEAPDLITGNGGKEERERIREEHRIEGPLPQASCPRLADNCEVADGRIFYVERVDPDGDGDAHFVLVSDESITGPGFSVIDVRKDLRPDPLPGPGDFLSAAGPVYPGSYGQLQIQADEVKVKYQH
jgi:hypothetical protein